MPLYRAREGAESYGHAIGMIMLDTVEPFIPGDVGNASTFDFPLLYRAVPGLTVDATLNGDPEREESVVEAAIELERQGVRAISSNCGFLLYYQDAVAAAVSVPVFMSSLLQLPLVAASVGPMRGIGVITADATRLGNSLLARAGAPAGAAIHIAGLENKHEFRTSMLDEIGVLDSDKLEREIVETAQELIEHHPDTGAILFECALISVPGKVSEKPYHRVKN